MEGGAHQVVNESVGYFASLSSKALTWLFLVRIPRRCDVCRRYPCNGISFKSSIRTGGRNLVGRRDSGVQEVKLPTGWLSRFTILEQVL